MKEIEIYPQSANWDYTGVRSAHHHRFGSSYSLLLVSYDGYPGLTLEDGTHTCKYNAFMRTYDENGNTKENLLLALPRDVWWKLCGLSRAYSHLELADCGLGDADAAHDSALFEMSNSIDHLQDELHMRINDVIRSIMKQRR